jgi:hypothetical protein
MRKPAGTRVVLALASPGSERRTVTLVVAK